MRNRAGSVYVSSGESDKAIAQFEAAQRMNPRDPKSLSFALSGTTAAHFFARRFEDCVHSGRRVLASLPASNLARRHVAAALAHLGRIDEAQAEIATLLSHQPNSSLARSRLSSFCHYHQPHQGNPGAARHSQLQSQASSFCSARSRRLTSDEDRTV